MFPFTKTDLENFITDIISLTARDIKIQDFEFKSRVELLTEIKSTDPNAMNLLEEFITTYREWYNYNYDEYGNGKANLPDQEKVVNLINRRDNTRQKLLDYIRS